MALCVFLVDLRHEPMEGDLTMRAFLDHNQLPYVIAATKADKLGRGEMTKRRRALEAGLGSSAKAVFAVSAETKAGHRRAVEDGEGHGPRSRGVRGAA